MIKDTLSAILKPHYMSILKYVGAGFTLAISIVTIQSTIKKTFYSTIQAYEQRSIERERISDSIQNANFERFSVKIINKLEDQDSSINKIRGDSREIINIKKENYRLWKENVLYRNNINEKKKYDNQSTLNPYPQKCIAISPEFPPKKIIQTVLVDSISRELALKKSSYE